MAPCHIPAGAKGPLPPPGIVSPRRGSALLPGGPTAPSSPLLRTVAEAPGTHQGWVACLLTIPVGAQRGTQAPGWQLSTEGVEGPQGLPGLPVVRAPWGDEQNQVQSRGRRVPPDGRC